MYTLIVNPISGNGLSLKMLPALENVMRKYTLAYRVCRTGKPGDATVIARECARAGDEGVVVVGGDGTIFEALNGLIGSALTVLYAPCGTGNDFVKCMHMPVDAQEALQMQLRAKAQPLDYGMVNDLGFMNVCGTGFDVDVLRETFKYKQNFKGLGAYLRGVRDAIKNFIPFECEIAIDDGAFERKHLTILSVGNGQYIGGGMKAVPDANPYDGALDVVMVRAIKKWQVPFLLPFFVLGKHTILPISSTLRVKRIRVRRAGMTLQLDGELKQMDEADIRVIPGGLRARYEL